MTEKLYDRDASQTAFSAKVTGCTPEGNAYWVELEQTAFFPEGGGQYADTGTLNGLEVLDVRIRDGIIYHKLSEPLPAGSLAQGLVNRENRFDNMQQHSGEHIISGLVHSRFGYDNVGFHLGRDAVTLDFNGPLSKEDLAEIEAEANRAVTLNIPVRVSFPSPQELSQMTYRSKIELTGAVRIVEFPGYDICACCAPHVKRTGEIGIIKITGVMKHRGGVRVNILCGMRALADYQQKQTGVSDISVQLSAKPEAVSAAVKHLKDENFALQGRLMAMQEQLLAYKIAALPDGLKHAFLFEADLDSAAMRKCVNAMTSRFDGYCAVFAGSDGTGYRFILGSSSLNCQEAAGLLREKLGAKGGGSAPMIQGSVSATETDIRALFNS